MAKVSRKQLLRKQDEFLTFTEKAGQWGKHHKRRLWMGCALVVVVVAIVLGITTYKRYQHNTAAMAYGQSFYLQQMAQSNYSPETLTMLIQSYDQVAQTYASTPAALQARLNLASLCMASGDYAKAEDWARKLTQESGVPQEMLTLSWGILGQCLELQDKNAEAAQAYAKAITLSGRNSANIWKTAQARLLTSQDKQAAVNLYEQVLATSQNGYLRFNATRVLIDMGKSTVSPTVN